MVRRNRFCLLFMDAPGGDSLQVAVACPLFLFEWFIEYPDFIRGRGTKNGVRLCFFSRNWWSRRAGEAIVYRTTVIDSTIPTPGLERDHA